MEQPTPERNDMPKIPAFPRFGQVEISDNGMRACQINLLISIQASLLAILTELAALHAANIHEPGEDPEIAISKVAEAAEGTYGRAIIDQVAGLLKEYG